MVEDGDTLLLSRRRELRQAVHDLRYRKLSESSRWASTQLQGMRRPQEEEKTVTHSLSTDMACDVELCDAYDLAVSYFENRVRNLCCEIACWVYSDGVMVL